MNKFIEERLWHHSTKSFFDPIKKLKLSTFSTMKKTKSYVINNKVVLLQANKDLFPEIVSYYSTKKACKFKNSFSISIRTSIKVEVLGSIKFLGVDALSNSIK